MQRKKVGLATLAIVATLLGCAALDESRPATQPASKAAASASTPRPGGASPTRAAPTATDNTTPTPDPATTETPVPGTPGGTPEASTPTVVAFGSPPAQPAAASGYRRHISTLYPYALDYPQNWQVIPGGATSGDARADLFAGEQHGQALTSVTVYSQEIAPETDSRFFADAVLAGLAAAEISPGQEHKRAVAGADTFVVEYTITHEGQTYAISEAAFVQAGRGWVVTLTSAPEEATRLRSIFDHMLATMQVWE